MPKQPQTAREHHYYFAHHLIKDIVSQNPAGALSALLSPENDAFINTLWSKVLELPAENTTPAIKHQETTIELTVCGEKPVILITMPKTHYICEAALIAIVLNTDESFQKLQQDKPFHYFTLEYHPAEEADAPPSYFICSWDGDTHANYLQTPYDDEASFLEAINQILDG